MSSDEMLVGTIALLFAFAAAVVAVGPWKRPYQLRTISAISRKFGKPAARGVWIAIAVAALTAGLAILNGLRPSYAVPAPRAAMPK